MTAAQQQNKQKKQEFDRTPEVDKTLFLFGLTGQCFLAA
jgi:hypothetical protein